MTKFISFALSLGFIVGVIGYFVLSAFTKGG